MPFIGTLFLFVFISNWGGALIPWKLIKLPSGELGAPTADINTTIALALLVSLSYFYAGLSNKGWRYFEYYVHPTPIMLPFKILEDFTKPLSLSFRLFGNILADELVVGVLVFSSPLSFTHTCNVSRVVHKRNPSVNLCHTSCLLYWRSGGRTSLATL